MPHPSETDDGTDRISTLYCPDCTHHSPYDGDWRLQGRGDRLAFVCPDCGTVLTTIPRTEEGPVLPEEHRDPEDGFAQLLKEPVRIGLDAGSNVLDKVRPDRSTPAD